jgi:hypothetical protein
LALLQLALTEHLLVSFIDWHVRERLVRGVRLLGLNEFGRLLVDLWLLSQLLQLSLGAKKLSALLELLAAH